MPNAARWAVDVLARGRNPCVAAGEGAAVRGFSRMPNRKQDMTYTDIGRLDGLDRLLSSRTICGLLDISDRQLRRFLATGRFPPADLRLGRSLRWKSSTVRAYLGPENEPAKR